MFAPGPFWRAGEPATRQDRAVIGPHLLRMRDLYDSGRLVFGGPTADGFAGMAILETDSEAEAKAIINTDPAVFAGVMTYTLATLNPYFDAFAGRAWTPPTSLPLTGAT